MKPERLQDQLSSLAGLEDPLRRRLYFFVAEQPEEVGRDQAARARKISRSLAAFHLDKLVEAGLLETSFKRLSNRRGPGAGRPSKLYRRSPRQIDVSLPERRYELAGQLMTSALDAANAGKAREDLRQRAHAYGERLGAEAVAAAKTDAGPEHALTQMAETLREAGFEPRLDEHGGLELLNCPFDAFARTSRDVVCGMNLALIEGVLAGLKARGWTAVLEPAPGRCCVVVRPESKGAER